ncbi:MAG: RagB/SusD family nutrient uptake outer membrane protein, partial [Rikenellaceae bacterium]|nr:RagB/SusD family nutrient uptake outer membrane protein [Rikenellaceae bacterium]
MKKRITLIRLAQAGLLCTVIGLLACGCGDDFLKNKRLYNGGGWEIFDNYGLAQARVDYLYTYSLPESTEKRSATRVNAGVADEWSTMMTWEYGGSPTWGDAASELSVSNNNLPTWFGTNKPTEGVYMHIRNANVCLVGLQGSKLGEEGTRTMRGETYFWRAWNYMMLFQYFGGVPLIDYPQDPILSTNDGADLMVNRSTTRETYEFIQADLEQAIELLPEVWPASETGRLTKAAAAALKGRMALLWASPLFNRTDDPQRWSAAYEACQQAYEIALAAGHRLVESTASENAKQWEQMFLHYDSPEAVMVTLYNSKTDRQLQKLNGWEKGCRPSTNVIIGGGTRLVPAEMIDLWPMADGKEPGDSSFAYNELAFFHKRDPRFYRTFA